jgi:hypothetical protein
MFKKIKSFLLLSLATIMMLSCTTVAFAQSDPTPGFNNAYGKESYIFSLFISKMLISSCRQFIFYFSSSSDKVNAATFILIKLDNTISALST